MVIEFLDFIKNQTRIQPQVIGIDRFCEIINQLEKLCATRGIALYITVLDTAKQNSKVKRARKTLNN